MKIRFDAGMAIMLLFLGLWFIGCDQEATTPVSSLENEGILAAPSAAASWHTLSDAQRNQKILDEAKKWVGKPDGQGGNCKEWVRSVVKTASAGVSIVPSTDTNPGTYYQAQWVSDKYVEVKWKMAYACPTYFPSFLRPGQIIQLRWVKSVMNGGPHTAIIKSVSSSSMEWWDSNFVVPGKVYDHPFSLAD